VCILSGDRIARHLAVRLHAKLVIFCLDVDGIYVKGEGGSSLAREFSASDLPRVAELPTKNADVTGGMRGKIEEILKLAEAPVDIYLINGLKEGLLSRALKGERGLGTEIR